MLGDALRGLRDVLQGLPYLIGVLATGGRERDALAFSLEQQRAGQCFQLLDLVANRAVCQMQFLGGAGDATQTSGGFKGA